jgi:hypothetical protein
MLGGAFGGGGYYMRSNVSAYMISTGYNYVSNTIDIPFWTPENKSNVYPSGAFTGDGRFLGLQNRSFLRLQDLTLSYSFRNSWVRNLKIQNLKVFLTGKNIFTLTKWEGGDPEIGSVVRTGDYPVFTTYSLGANISF